ncbi:hypothetical protein PGTUg99_020915 [Puccinia graminis f. sp. tritici]|uniref:Uncharacterized protein n=1 Tax=Puccinia graminis f. sp. tritici TaxID=56615 RepID=A0A5B0RKR4_PUCGR|nr:hypothetical protein PGTUg99_020915 [Puccinia graminis f. sp. tritici]
MFLLAEYIIKFELLPPSFTATMKIFEPTILMQLIKSYISAGNGVAKMVSNYYFNSFMPGIVFLKTSAFMEPFRRAIEEILSSSDQNLLVYHLIKSFMQPSLKRIHYKTLPRDEQSRRIWKGFCADTFLQDLDALSLISTSNTIDENERKELIQTHKIAPLIQEMITYFDNPPDYCYGYSDKFEIYHILSIIDFLKRNYRSIIDELTPETIDKPDLNKKMECINYLVNHFEHHHNKYSYEALTTNIEYLMFINMTSAPMSTL